MATYTIHGRLDSATGLLSDITHRPMTYDNDVPLVAMPSEPGPYNYDSTNMLAVPVVDREPRMLYEIYADLQRLTTAEWNAVWADISAAVPGVVPKKYLQDAGKNASSIFCMDWSVYSSGATGAQQKVAQMDIVTFYVQDNPTYLVHPKFAPGINIPGDREVGQPKE